MLFSETLEKFRKGHLLGHLVEQTGITEDTLKNWLSGRADKRGPQKWGPIVWLAAALRLTALETTELLESAGKPSFEQIRQLTPEKGMAGEQERTAKAIDEILARSTAAVNTRLRSPLHVNVPPKPNYFIGRDKFIEVMEEKLNSGSCMAIAIEGLPGVGKTTAAIALTHSKKILHHFCDGILWASLGQYPDIMSVLTQWARSLGQDTSHLSSEREVAQAIKTTIGQRYILLVLDDVWDIKIANLLRCGGPNCCHLLTTRNKSIARQFAGTSQVVTMQILEYDSAYQLLAELAPEICAVDEDAARRVVKVAGGLPLTLTLLGGYLAAPEHYLFSDLQSAALNTVNDFQRRLQLATERLGSLDNAELTLEQVIELSLIDLPENVQDAFYTLGAFAPKPECFDREAVEFVTRMQGGEIAILINRNLIERVDKDILTLHQTLSDVARTKTQTNAVERHQNYYRSLVKHCEDQWETVDIAYGQIKWAWQNIPDDEKIIRFREILHDYQIARSRWNDWFEWVHRVLRVAQFHGWQSTEADMFLELGRVYAKKLHYENAVSSYEKSIKVYSILNEKYRKSVALKELADVYTYQGTWRLGDAILMYEESLDIINDLNESGNLVWDYANIKCRTLIKLGYAYTKQKNWVKAVNLYEEVINISGKDAIKYVEGRALNGLGDVFFAQGDLEKACAIYKESLDLCTKQRDWYGLCQAHNCLASISINYKRWDEAITSYNKSLNIYRSLDDKLNEALTIKQIGYVYKKQEKWDDAITLYEESLEIINELGDFYRAEGIYEILDELYISKKLSLKAKSQN
jgi:tetratricopeptide (TPR) repeat protein